MNFVVPSNASYPRATWGFRLGAECGALRRRGRFLYLPNAIQRLIDAGVRLRDLFVLPDGRGSGRAHKSLLKMHAQLEEVYRRQTANAGASDERAALRPSEMVSPKVAALLERSGASARDLDEAFARAQEAEKNRGDLLAAEIEAWVASGESAGGRRGEKIGCEGGALSPSGLASLVTDVAFGEEEVSFAEVRRRTGLRGAVGRRCGGVKQTTRSGRCCSAPPARQTRRASLGTAEATAKRFESQRDA